MSPITQLPQRKSRFIASIPETPLTVFISFVLIIIGIIGFAMAPISHEAYWITVAVVLAVAFLVFMFVLEDERKVNHQVSMDTIVYYAIGVAILCAFSITGIILLFLRPKLKK
jgi:hypothetical protein